MAASSWRVDATPWLCHSFLDGPFDEVVAATQLWVQGPDGELPLGHVRTLGAHGTDGRWPWHESGPVQSFEDPSCYQRRRVRDRLDRPRLVSYLRDLGIRVDEPGFYGAGVVLTQLVEWDCNSESVTDFRRESGW